MNYLVQGGNRNITTNPRDSQSLLLFPKISSITIWWELSVTHRGALAGWEEEAGFWCLMNVLRWDDECYPTWDACPLCRLLPRPVHEDFSILLLQLSASPWMGGGNRPKPFQHNFINMIPRSSETSWNTEVSWFFGQILKTRHARGLSKVHRKIHIQKNCA